METYGTNNFQEKYKKKRRNLAKFGEYVIVDKNLHKNTKSYRR